MVRPGFAGGELINAVVEPTDIGDKRDLHAFGADALGDPAFGTLSFATHPAAALAHLNAVPMQSAQLMSLHSGPGIAGAATAALHISAEGSGSDGPNSLWLQYDHVSAQIWLNVDSDGDKAADLTFDVTDDFGGLIADLQSPLSEPPGW